MLWRKETCEDFSRRRMIQWNPKSKFEDVYYRRHFLKAERQSGQLRHHVITTDQSGVFPKIASQS